METNVITITRLFGSMGRPIAKAVAQKLGYEYYDRDIIDAAAAKVHTPIEKYLGLSERKLTKYDKMMYPLGIGDAIKQDMIFQAEKEVILDLTEKKNCVLVGRCSDYIMKTSGHQNLFNIFIYAPYEVRKKFCIRELNIVPERVDDYIVRVDEGRSEFYQRHTGADFRSDTYRNLMLDSSFLPREQLVDSICHMAEYKFQQSK